MHPPIAKVLIFSLVIGVVRAELSTSNKSEHWKKVRGNKQIGKEYSLESRIVGGKETIVEQNPWQVSFQRFGRHWCGGSIIGAKWVLTAAHCTQGARPEGSIVRVGSSYHAKDGPIIKVKMIHDHPMYIDTEVDYDFSLLELSEPLKFNDKIKAIKLASEGLTIEDGTSLRVTGWGSTKRPNEHNDVLRSVDVTYINAKTCNEKYEKVDLGTINEKTMLCAGTEKGGKDACQGDSGGPLSMGQGNDRTLVGIVSWGYDCAKKDYPGVYARVSAVRSWIKQVTSI